MIQPTVAMRTGATISDTVDNRHAEKTVRTPAVATSCTRR